MIRINGELNSITINGAPVPTTINPYQKYILMERVRMDTYGLPILIL